jgi:hypothetical protein
VTESVLFSFRLRRAEFYTSNQVIHRMAASDLKIALREMAKREALGRGVRLDCAALNIEMQWPDRRRRDAPNIWPAVKPLVDGLVLGGLLPDDDDEHIPYVTFRSCATRSGETGVTVFNLRFTPTTYIPYDPDYVVGLA